MSSTPSASSDPARPPRPAPVVPDYQLDRHIGRGSYGEVWLAHSTLGTRRAVKVVYRDSFDSERPYLREFAGIRAYEPISSHESQVSVFHVGKNDEAGYFYYVMELADDAASLAKAPATPLVAAESPANPPAYAPATLAVLLKQRGRLPCAEALPLAHSLASALDRLHGHGLVHRDIKPANIIFVNGRPKLADIGLVTSAAEADTLVGTTGYIPPEGPGTSAADLFSFGKVLYEVVTGHDRQEFPMLPDDLGQLPDREQLLEVNEIILKCCHLDPRERYATGAELLADLKRIEAGQSLRRDRSRRRQLVVAAGVVVLVAGFFAAQRIWPPETGPAAKPVPAKPAVTGSSLAVPGGLWTNSLGMAFVPIAGLPVEFCLWETRVRDYEVFATETKRPPKTIRSPVRGNTNLISWSSLGTAPLPNHPVRVVTWEDAKAFCDWLTERERRAGGLQAGESYRLPTDLEWSWAAGLTNETGATPLGRHNAGTNTNVFYWGTNWPPPAGAGNFSDEKSVMFQHIPGYRDPFPVVAPVGSFPPERHGLFDLAGNVAEWCEDTLLDPDQNPVRVARGAAYENSGRAAFRVTRRMFFGLDNASSPVGFRVVRVPQAGRAPVVTPRPLPAPSSSAPAQQTNSLGMVFTPVPGLAAEFCLWETRVRDYRAFVKATGHQSGVAHYAERLSPTKKVYRERRWDDETVAAQPDLPVRAVSGTDARAFCEWLTTSERERGLLPAGWQYRLPRDSEWSWAAGLTNEIGATTEERFQSAARAAAFPWGTNWPPPAGFGNFSGRESAMSVQYQIAGYRDAFPTAAPVGSFAVERHGLFDLAGNLSEICEDWPARPEAPLRFVRRGASWDASSPAEFEIRHRHYVSPHRASTEAGFRVVRVPVGDASVPPK